MSGDTRHAGRLPFAACRVVKASRTLGATNKLVYMETYALANGTGGSAWISASGLARRLGISRVTVERSRQELLRDGLLTKQSRGPGRTDAWRPGLPQGCRPTSQRLTDDDLERLAEALDRHLATVTEPHPTVSEVGVIAVAGLGQPHSRHE